MRKLSALAGLVIWLSACGGDPLPNSAEVSYAKPAPKLDSLPEASVATLDTVLKARKVAGDTLPLPAAKLVAALPATLIGFAEPEVTDAQDLDVEGGRMSTAKALFFDEHDNYLEVKLYDLSAAQSLARSIVEEYRSADGTELNGSHYSRLPVMPKGRIGFIRKEADTYSAVVLADFRHQLVVETDAPCEASCFMQVVEAVKWEVLK
jgi:hypothetical protein